MKDKIILKDETTMELETAASLASMTVVFTDWRDAASVMTKLTEDNLASVQVKTEEGLTVGTYKNLVLQPGSWEVKEDGVHITISLREKTDFEKRLDKVESGQEVQGEAIAELTEMIGGGQ